MPRIPLPSGSRIAIVNAPDDALLLRPTTPSEGIADVGAAVRDALRFPLSGAPLEALVKRGGSATIVVEPPELPLPGAPNDPRREALAATLAELERLGVSVAAADDPDRGRPQPPRRAPGAGGAPPTDPRPPLPRRGRGSRRGGAGPRARSATPGAHRSASTGRSLETDLVVCVTAAETVLHGGPGALLGACGPETLRAATAYSLLETAAARGWQLGLALERALAARVPVIGASLVLNPPRLLGSLPRLPLRGGVAPPPRRLSAAPALSLPSRSAPQDPPGPRARADGRRRLRRAAVGRSRGGSRSGGSRGARPGSSSPSTRS